MTYSVLVEGSAQRQLEKLDKSIQIIIVKKLVQMESKKIGRHLKHGSPFFVEEIGQYRIAFKVLDANKEKKVYFIGDHKEYEKWYNQFF
ncbi:MAG: hypothetical protein Q7K42_05355 [Candidatus Diapherotrites archaeon]|nr:hypothetical protein [Candidatus Diapherotrites archaeon]